MNELTVVERTNEWRRMKSLVLDSVSSPITKRVYNMALDEFFGWVRPGAAARLHQSHRERVARIPGGTRAGVVVHHRPDVGDPQAGRRGDRQRAEHQGSVPGRCHQALYRLTNSIIIVDRRDDGSCRTCLRTEFSNHDSIITAGAEEAPLYVYLACPAPHASVSGRAGPGAGPGSLRIRSLRTHRQGRERDEKSD